MEGRQHVTQYLSGIKSLSNVNDPNLSGACGGFSMLLKTLPNSVVLNIFGISRHLSFSVGTVDHPMVLLPYTVSLKPTFPGKAAENPQTRPRRAEQPVTLPPQVMAFLQPSLKPSPRRQHEDAELNTKHRADLTSPRHQNPRQDSKIRTSSR